MTAEASFLITALRRALNGETAPPYSRNLDWSALLRLADAHAVIPLLDKGCRGLSIPDEFAHQLRLAIERLGRWSLTQSAELVRLAGLLEKHQVPLIALKGPLLNLFLYGDVSMRSSADIDLLVKRGHVRLIRDILTSNGYRISSTLHWNSNAACLHSRENEISFVSPLEVSIDIHWRLLPPYFASAFDKVDAWKSTENVILAGQTVQTLMPESLFLFLSAHGAKHMFERLGWICDIARFLTVAPDLNWDFIVSHARSTSTSRQLLLGVALAKELLGTPVPERLRADPQVEALVHIIRDRLFAGAIQPAPALESNRFSLRLLERHTQRVRYLAGLYLMPSEADYRALQLPGWLYLLYYPYRPIRLFWRHAIQRSIHVV